MIVGIPMTEAQQQIKKWRESPVAFVREVFGVEPDPWQLECLTAFPHKQRIAMKACKGPGKTCLLAWLCWNFLATREQPNCAAVSITEANLKDGMWKEMAKWQLKSKFLMDMFKVTKTRIFAKEFSDTWWLSARSFPKQGDAMQQADALAGLHADYLLFILDEAGGIPDAVMATAEAGLSTGIETKIVIAGNPTHLEGPLYRACTSQRHMWHTIEITGDPDDPDRSPRIDIQWARDQIEQYGRDNPWVLVNVFGKFPPSSLNVLLGVDEVNESMKKRLDTEAVAHSQRRLGVDVARFGDDRTVIQFRQGLFADDPIILRNMRSNDVAARVAVEADKRQVEAIYVDDTGGYGGGVIDCLLQVGYNPIPINFSGKADDPRYFNKRSEMWFRVAEWVKRGGKLPQNVEYVRELTTVQYSFQKNQFRLEDKNQIKQRLGYSPDIGDALALTHAAPEMPTGQVWSQFQKNHGHRRNGGVQWDYDPFSEENMGDD